MKITEENIDKITLVLARSSNGYLDLCYAPRWSVEEGDKVCIDGEVEEVVRILMLSNYEFDKVQFLMDALMRDEATRIDGGVVMFDYADEEEDEGDPGNR